jgi:hypothetical protein
MWEDSNQHVRGSGMPERWNQNGDTLKLGLMLTLESLLEQSLCWHSPDYLRLDEGQRVIRKGFHD